MSDAEKYTTEMWQRHLGSVVVILHSSDARRRAFVSGFNGEPERTIHHTHRDAWKRGRHSAVLLGYIKETPDAP